MNNQKNEIKKDINRKVNLNGMAIVRTKVDKDCIQTSVFVDLNNGMYTHTIRTGRQNDDTSIYQVYIRCKNGDRLKVDLNTGRVISDN